MPKYGRPAEIKQFLESKIRFAETGSLEENAMTQAFFETVVSQAESQLEIDLMMRYDIPLRAQDSTFEKLPEGTRLIIRTAAELISVVRLLETDFGRGTSANSEKYTERLEKRYNKIVEGLMEVKKDTYQTWLRPPLAGLQLAYCNQGDTGFRARVHNTSTQTHHADYAIDQINDPGENLFNGTFDKLDLGTGE